MAQRVARDRGWLLLLPALALLAGVLLVPLAASFWRSISDPSLTLDNYTELFTDGITLKVLGRTAWTASVVTAVAFVLGYPYAYLMTRVGPALRGVLLTVVLIPFWTSALARNFAWLILLYNHGPIQRALAWLGFGDVVLFGTAAGVTVAMCQVMLPFMVLPLFSALGGIDRRLLLAARSLGSSPARAFWKVYWPLSRAGAVSGAVLVWTLSLGFYVTPALLGSPQQSLVAQLLGQRTTELLDFAGAGALGTLILVLTLVLVACANRFGGGLATVGAPTPGRTSGTR